MKHPRGFGSDNNAGVHPLIMEALMAANIDHVPGYGADRITEEAVAAFQKLFGCNVPTYFVANGTGANVLSLTAAARSFNGVICSAVAHAQGSEYGAAENHIGCKLLPVPTRDGKITVDQLSRFLEGAGDQHTIQPRVISLTNATEYGTVYTQREIVEIARFARRQCWFIHVDGARIANAVASLGVNIRDLTDEAGVDILSFGGTKNGMMYGEAVVIFNPELASNFKYIRMQGMQLLSKMRFVSAQFLALLKDDLWLKNAEHANQMTRYLVKKLGSIPYVHFAQEVETNQIFLKVPKSVIPSLKEKYFFYVWDEDPTDDFCAEIRLVTAFDTQQEEVDDFCEILSGLISNLR